MLVYGKGKPKTPQYEYHPQSYPDITIYYLLDIQIITDY